MFRLEISLSVQENLVVLDLSKKKELSLSAVFIQVSPCSISQKPFKSSIPPIGPTLKWTLTRAEICKAFDWMCLFSRWILWRPDLRGTLFYNSSGYAQMLMMRGWSLVKFSFAFKKAANTMVRLCSMRPFGHNIELFRSAHRHNGRKLHFLNWGFLLGLLFGGLESRLVTLT